MAWPSKTTVELKLGFALEAGKLTALWVGGKGEAATRGQAIAAARSA